MGKRNGQVLVGAMVPAQQATAFRDLAQAANLGVSAALRQMIAERIEAAKGQGEDLLPKDVAVGHSKRITIRLRDSELAILTQAAKNAGTPIANLIRSIVLNHLACQKQWNEIQSDQLLAIEREMRKIVIHLNGLTSALGDGLEDDGRGSKAAAEAASTIHAEINRLTKIMEQFAAGGARPDNRAKQVTGSEIKIRLKEPERLALDQGARARDTTAANWVRSLTVVHLSGRPQWSANELNELRTISDHLRRIGSDINVIAGIINGAVRTGAYPPEQGLAVKEAAELVRYEGRRLAAVMTGNFDYWGLPTDQRPRARPGAVELATLQAELAEAKRRERQRNQSRRRYTEDEDGN
jgi:hypothetical protein